MEEKTQLAEQPLTSAKVLPKPEKKAKPEHKPQKDGDSRTQKEVVIPGVVDFGLIQEALKAPNNLQTPGTYRFGRLSHHSFFSRHHPHTQHVTHIQDSTGKPICLVRDESSLVPLPPPTLLSNCLMGMPTISDPIGDPQSNRNPELSSETWKKKLKELTSRIAFFTKEDELMPKESLVTFLSAEGGPPREHGAKYSAETGRLIPASSQALTRRSRQGQQHRSSNRDKAVQDLLLQDQELLILELLCQILQTDSLRAIQFWLLYAPQKEKDLALGLLQTAVAQLLPQPLTSIPAEKLLSQLQDMQALPPEKQMCSSSFLKKIKTSSLPKSERPEYMGKAQVLRVHSSEDTEEKVSESKTEG